MSQRDIAVLVGTTRQSVSLWERGLRRPRPATLAAILSVLRALGVRG